jgi:dCTP deaminase
MHGALPDHKIRELVNNKFIGGVSNSKSIRPSSLDLTITGEAYRVRGTFLPGVGESVMEAFKRVGSTRLVGEKILLERGCCYVLPLNESIIELPQGVYAYCNPKSSSGRVDMHVRLLVDGCARYDAVESKYRGQMYLLVVPKTFPVIISPGLSLNQIRFFNADTRFSEWDLQMNFNGLIFDVDGNSLKYGDQRHSDRDGSILLSLGLGFKDNPGFEAIEGGDPIDLSLISHYDPKYYFRRVSVFNNSITLTTGTFYILSTREYVVVPPHLTCEMVPMDERSGDLRSHYAGFIDPGWGVTQQATTFGRTLTLEVRSFDNGIIIQDGQPIAKVRYEKVWGDPEYHYDESSPTYGLQNGPKLGKQFSSPT